MSAPPRNRLARLRARLAAVLAGDAPAEPLAAVTVQVDDGGAGRSGGWDSLSAGPADRSWAERLEDLDDALEAWQKNPLVRRIVTLTRSYVVAGGVTVSSRIPAVDAFIRAFWSHPRNRLERRLGPMCDELTRCGELFPVLFTNPTDGMSYVRFVPARQIVAVETDPEDYETELGYQQVTATGAPRAWLGAGNPRAFRRGRGRRLEPLMLHFAVNRPIGATRGEGDLTPVLPWVRRYSEWLKDRVRLNRLRTRQALLDLEISDDSMVEEKRRQLTADNPVEAGIYVHGAGERVTLHSLALGGADAAPDGEVLRLAIAAGANVGLHYLGEGGDVNYATAREMGEPTARFYAERQQELIGFLQDLVEAAYRRHTAATPGAPVYDDLQLVASASEPARADNQSLAAAAHTMVQALRAMREAGWVDDATAARLAFKFAGEPLGEREIARMMEGV
ncbi:MAG: hypothetical protein GX601_01535 [Anaerolineales bacterium]|nr:hypothetical protein [Anaerolineales bacterium]